MRVEKKLALAWILGAQVALANPQDPVEAPPTQQPAQPAASQSVDAAGAPPTPSAVSSPPSDTMQTTVPAVGQPGAGDVQPAAGVTPGTSSVGISETAKDDAFLEEDADLADTLLTLDDVVVTGARGSRSREDAVVQTEVINRAEIEVSGARTVGDLLRTHPGVQIDENVGGTAISIQGLDPDYLLVLVNGERTVGRVNGAIDLSRYRVEDIERVEIVRGASSSLYGSDAIAGVVNIITRQSLRPLEADATMQYGTLGRMDLSGGVGLMRGAWSTRFTAGWHQGDGYDLDPETVATTGNAYDTLNVANTTRFQSGDAQINGDVNFMRRDQRGVDQNTTGATFDRRNLVETFSAAVRPEFKLGTGSIRFNGAYSLYRDQYLLDQRGSDILDQYQNTHEQLVELGTQYDQRLGAHQLTVGAEGLYEALSSERLASGSGSRLRGSLYAQDEWTLIEPLKLIAVPGLRVDADSQFGTYLSPKLSARIDPVRGVAVRASYGFGYRAPNFKDLYLRFENPGVGYVVEGNEDLQPETSRSANLGVEVKPVSWMTASANLFRNDIKDLIAYVMIEQGGSGGMTRYRNQNVSSAHTQGVETMFRFVPLRGLTTDLGYTFTDSLDHDTGLQLAGRSRHRGTFTVHYAYSPWKVDAMVRGNVRSPSSIQSVDAAGTIVELFAPTHASVDARLAKSFGDWVTVFVQAENLLGAGDPVLLPLMPRTVTAGLTARY